MFQLKKTTFYFVFNIRFEFSLCANKLRFRNRNLRRLICNLLIFNLLVQIGFQKWKIAWFLLNKFLVIINAIKCFSVLLDRLESLNTILHYHWLICQIFILKVRSIFLISIWIVPATFYSYTLKNIFILILNWAFLFIKSSLSWISWYRQVFFYRFLETIFRIELRSSFWIMRFSRSMLMTAQSAHFNRVIKVKKIS